MARNAGLFQRGKTWWIRYSKDGIQYRESAKTKRKEEAQALLNKRNTEIFEGEFFPAKRAGNQTVAELRDMWLLAAKHKGSVDDDAQRFATVVEMLGAATQVRRLTSEQLDRMRERLLERVTRRGTAMTPATVNRHLALLRSALRLAVKRCHIRQSPMDGVKFLPENNQRDRICSPAEYDQLLANANDPELRLAIQFGYWTGMRLGEILGLSRDRVDLVARTLKLAASETKEADSKQIPLPDEVVCVLKDWPRRLDGRLFTRKVSNVSASFGRLARAQKIDNLTFHDLRHTAATNLRRAGVDIFTIRKITGHKTIEMLERYNKVDTGDLTEAMRRLVALRGGNDESKTG